MKAVNMLNRIHTAEVCPSLPQGKLARDDAHGTKAGYIQFQQPIQDS
jgi:hypothetical protein